MSRRCSHWQAVTAAPASSLNLARTSEYTSGHPRIGCSLVSLQTGPATPGTPTLARFTGYETFPNPPPWVLPLTTPGKPKPSFDWCMTDAVSDLLHAQYRLSILLWNAGAARRQPTQLSTVMCGAFNAVLLQEARGHVQHISDQFQVYTDDEDLAILLNRDTFLPDSVKYPIIEESTRKTTWSLKALVVCGHLRRPPVGAPKTVTFCSVHLNNMVAKKRDAATSLFQRLRAHEASRGRLCGRRLQQSCQRHQSLQTSSVTQNSWPWSWFRSGVRKVMIPIAQGS